MVCNTPSMYRSHHRQTGPLASDGNGTIEEGRIRMFWRESEDCTPRGIFGGKVSVDL